jgi:hypothetical protein
MEAYNKRLRAIEAAKIKLERETGHVLLEPKNQYCKYCGDAMFVKELSSKKCRRRNIMPDYKVLERTYVEKIRIECNPKIDVKDITKELKLRGYKTKKVDFVEVSKNTKVYFINAEKNVKIKNTIKKGSK